MENDHDFAELCRKDRAISDLFSEPMVWIGIYIAVASFYCIIAMSADLLRGFRDKKFWFPCKYFSLNAASITVIAVAMKLPLDLTSPMPTNMDKAAKVGSLSFMCTMMANLMPSLASLDNNTLVANIIGWCILVITVIVNIWIQSYTGVIVDLITIEDGHYYLYSYAFGVCADMNRVMMILLLMMMVSLCLTIPTRKEILESKYQATKKILLTDQTSTTASTVEKLKQLVRRYWCMAETGSPQFVMASNPLSTASGVICVMVLLINLFLGFTIQFDVFKMLLSDFKNAGGSSYKWSTSVIFITQSIGVVVGAIAPISRCFLVFNFKLATKRNRNYFRFYKVEKHWTQMLREWKQSPVPFQSDNRRSRSLINKSKNFILSLCIGFQKVNVILCKLIWLIVTVVLTFVVSCFYHLKARCITSRTDDLDDIDDDLNNYVLQIDNHTELDEKTLKGISQSINSFISKAEKEQSNNLSELLKKSTGFEGVRIFDTDNVQPLLPIELVNSWSLPVITLTCIAVALPNIHKGEVESLLRSVGEGLSFTHLVEESLNSANEYVNIRKTSLILWHEVVNKCKWLDNPLAKNVFKGKPATEILKCFSDKAKEIVTKINESTNGYLVDNPPKTLIAANSMYRITQTLLLRCQSNLEPITKKQLFAHLNRMIADIFSACFTNIPGVITIRCHERVLEKREASVKVAAKLLGKTTKIIERLETCELPSLDDDKMAYIDEWRLYLKHSIP